MKQKQQKQDLMNIKEPTSTLDPQTNIDQTLQN